MYETYNTYTISKGSQFNEPIINYPFLLVLQIQLHRYALSIRATNLKLWRRFDWNFVMLRKELNNVDEGNWWRNVILFVLFALWINRETVCVINYLLFCDIKLIKVCFACFRFCIGTPFGETKGRDPYLGEFKRAPWVDLVSYENCLIDDSESKHSVSFTITTTPPIRKTERSAIDNLQPSPVRSHYAFLNFPQISAKHSPAVIAF